MSLASFWYLSDVYASISVMIKNIMHQGNLVPSEIIVKLLLKAMLESGNDKFLVDGFPRNEENRLAYERIVSLLL